MKSVKFQFLGVGGTAEGKDDVLLIVKHRFLTISITTATIVIAVVVFNSSTTTTLTTTGKRRIRMTTLVSINHSRNSFRLPHYTKLISTGVSNKDACTCIQRITIDGVTVAAAVASVPIAMTTAEVVVVGDGHG
jgi:hypothetical protein